MKGEHYRLVMEEYGGHGGGERQQRKMESNIQWRVPPSHLLHKSIADMCN